jgi:hypothetical protein
LIHTKWLKTCCQVCLLAIACLEWNLIIGYSITIISLKTINSKLHYVASTLTNYGENYLTISYMLAKPLAQKTDQTFMFKCLKLWGCSNVQMASLGAWKNEKRNKNIFLGPWFGIVK